MVGRSEEQLILRDALRSEESELIAVYGRRRVGKTFMIRNFYKDHMLFELSGLYQGTLGEHMEEFASKFQSSGLTTHPVKTPSSWFEAFALLKPPIEKSRSRKKKVLFFDEVPWMATNRSRFLTAFENFWNGWASARSDLVVVICGSAASWMINKIEKNKGGLYNRVTKRIRLQPFTLAETAAFLKSKRISLTQYHITQLYMVMGGIPHYLNLVRPGETPDQAVDRLCFSKGGVLIQEFDELFDSLFGEGKKHRKVVEVLAKYRKGLQRNDLIQKSKLESGGGTSAILDELDASGFIAEYIPFGKKNKDKVYKLTDPYSLFYHKYIKPKRIRNWQAVSPALPAGRRSTSWSSWSGLAFENMCQHHTPQILKALEISGINTFVSSWIHRGTSDFPGAQIDLLIDRGDKAINLCEIKYNHEPFLITKKYADQLRMKKASFLHFTKSRKSIFYTFITAGGLVQNEYSKEIVQSQVGLRDLF